MPMADALGDGYGGRQTEVFADQRGTDAFGEVGPGSSDVAHPQNSEVRSRHGEVQEGARSQETERLGDGGSHAMGDAECLRLDWESRRGPGAILADGRWWAVEPNVGRVAHGVPSRVDRLRALGNAVVPQVAEWIGQRILEAA
jgi:DNA (cytosine-5)-methyltransferase 1